MKNDSRPTLRILVVALCVVLPCLGFVGCQTTSPYDSGSTAGAQPSRWQPGGEYGGTASLPTPAPPTGLNAPTPLDAYSDSGQSTIRSASSMMGLPSVGGPRPKAYVVKSNEVDSIGQGQYHRYMTDAERVRIQQQTQQAYNNLRYTEPLY
jgi:hypothetical protein